MGCCCYLCCHSQKKIKSHLEQQGHRGGFVVFVRGCSVAVICVAIESEIDKESRKRARASQGPSFVREGMVCCCYLCCHRVRILVAMEESFRPLFFLYFFMSIWVGF